ncbi:MAG TPA: hypothetical protein VFQ72_03625 [Candidatus Paceibacterota bacterium]|nr:hypothetical protein [Candidatus Paceibacterota bacterium]
MKKRLATLTFIVIACVCSAETSISTGVWNKYLSPNAAIFHKDPVLQTVYSGKVAKGLEWEVFHSIGLDDSKLSSNWGDEIDWNLRWNSRFGQSDAYGLHATLGYWDVVDLFKSTPADVVYTNIAISRSLGRNVTGRLSHDHYFSTNVRRLMGGTMTTAELSAWTPVGEKMTLTFAPLVARDDGGFGFDPAWIFGASANISWRIKDNLSITLIKANCKVPLTGVRDGRKSELAIGMGLSFTL